MLLDYEWSYRVQAHYAVFTWKPNHAELWRLHPRWDGAGERSAQIAVKEDKLANLARVPEGWRVVGDFRDLQEGALLLFHRHCV